jgi:hypothetical protein
MATKTRQRNQAETAFEGALTDGASALAQAAENMANVGTESLKFAKSLVPRTLELQKRLLSNRPLSQRFVQTFGRAAVELSKARRDQRNHLGKIGDLLSDTLVEAFKTLASERTAARNRTARKPKKTAGKPGAKKKT